MRIAVPAGRGPTGRAGGSGVRGGGRPRPAGVRAGGADGAGGHGGARAQHAGDREDPGGPGGAGPGPLPWTGPPGRGARALAAPGSRRRARGARGRGGPAASGDRGGAQPGVSVGCMRRPTASDGTGGYLFTETDRDRGSSRRCCRPGAGARLDRAHGGQLDDPGEHGGGGRTWLKTDSDADRSGSASGRTVHRRSPRRQRGQAPPKNAHSFGLQRRSGLGPPERDDGLAIPDAASVAGSSASWSVAASLLQQHVVDMWLVGLPSPARSRSSPARLAAGARTKRTRGSGRLWSEIGGFRRVLSTPAGQARFDFSGRKEPTPPTSRGRSRSAARGSGPRSTGSRRRRSRRCRATTSVATRACTAAAGSMADFANDFNTTMHSAISSYQATQTSSSGGGGGGFSGGGGGGGGGGGSW